MDDFNLYAEVDREAMHDYLNEPPEPDDRPTAAELAADRALPPHRSSPVLSNDFRGAEDASEEAQR